MQLNRHPFAVIQGRYIIAIWFLPLLYLPGADWFLQHFAGDWAGHWWDQFYYYYSHLLLILTLLLLAWLGRLSWNSLLGQPVTRSVLIPGLKLTVFLLLFSIATAYLLFLPLSYVVPDFVEWWYIDAITIIYTDGHDYPLAVNTANFISLVILAPVTEEIAFRGFLLHRWSHKWGVIKAMLLASFFFAIVHADPIGAFAFGIGMSILYLRTQSLYLPILCHAANNLFVWLIEVVYLAVEGPETTYTLETFQQEWYVGVICGVLVILWAIRYGRQAIGVRTWRLPSIAQRA